MSYGLSVFKSDGSLVFSTADVTWMQLDKFIVNANASASNSYTEATGWDIIAQLQMVNDEPTDQEAYAPEITISGTTVSVAPYSGKSSEKVIIMVLAQDPE